MAAGNLLAKQGLGARIVSIPCLETFLAQPARYRQSVLGGRSVRVAVEAGHGALWWRLLGRNGLFIGVDSFGASAPDRVLAEKYGLTPESVAERIVKHLAPPSLPPIL
ncbi:transketolase-like TK C-terminal-containing protein [Geotalea toluenoxydans]|uniref:transketolase-like TK C-terminal-containing protein n=1 Tax=Geotalea toluenoxydans TaxID=421624 RepID=UPI000ADA9D4B|nr:hypothetical protein [Geotalea toluenoxydans]